MNVARSLMGCLFALVAQGCLSAGRERVPGPVLPAYVGEVATANRAPAAGRLVGYVWVGLAGPIDDVMARFEVEVAALGGNTAVVDGVLVYQNASMLVHQNASMNRGVPIVIYHHILYGRAFKVQR